MIRELVFDEEILSKPCEPATPDDAELAADLIDTLRSLDDAAALAANQIGVCKAVAVYLDDRDREHVLYNPKIVMGLRPSRQVEACLTHEDPSVVQRYAKVKVSFDELEDGVFKARRRDYTGWVAQIVQHMIDHCNGKLV